ncbi:SDR family NAD(P)-dependent oxidoreductase [Pseudonocardia spinosispora]|uniref:SDR family NAD(P)-dependent oxidoreductase n=1 Tax=Pseudonocardia spinosispora TaxID=103441 RepID=UPI000423D888|nr:SDR family NAD(P)-dependent oxidoreductase [Pseudonocardia spinosispora]
MSRVFLVTGSSRGLGRSIAEAVLETGHQLVATARTPGQLDDLVRTYGDQVRAVALDVTDTAAADHAVRTAVDEFGRLDVLVNNAGYANLASVEDITAEDFREQIDTNLLGVVNLTKAALPILREQGSGHIVQVSSVGGRGPALGLSAYQAAKFAVGGFSEVLNLEVAPLGIKVTVLEPGGMRTDWGGSSMSIPPVSEPYRATVGAFAEHIRTINDGAASDPAKVAQVLLRIVEMKDPPLRLLLGSDAVAVAGAIEAQRTASDAAWRTLSGSTDHADWTPAHLAALQEMLASTRRPS